MGHSTDVVGYTYKADEYCPECIVFQVTRTLPAVTGPNIAAVERELTALALWRGIDRWAEITFDSGEFPKVIFRDQLNSGEESPEQCGHCGRILGS
jgi:hypothetical protein